MQPQSVGTPSQPTGPVRLAAPGQAQAFEPGPIFLRFIALIIDGIIVSVITLPVGVVVGILMGVTAGVGSGASAQRAGAALMLQLLNIVFSVGVTFVYNGWFYRNKGATPGKLLFGLRVVDAETGTYLGWGQTFMREIVGRFVDMLTLAIGLIMAIFRSDKRALHDLVAGTQVLRVKK